MSLTKTQSQHQPGGKTRPLGFPPGAAFIAEDPDKTTTVHRRFERLAARNILYIESELIDLERQQDTLDEKIQGLEMYSLNGQNLERLRGQLAQELKVEPLALQTKEQIISVSKRPNKDSRTDLTWQRLYIATRIRETLKEYC